MALHKICSLSIFKFKVFKTQLRRIEKKYLAKIKCVQDKVILVAVFLDDAIGKFFEVVKFEIAACYAVMETLLDEGKIKLPTLYNEADFEY